MTQISNTSTAEQITYKCDTCVYKKLYLGAGAPDDYSAEYCSKGHWESWEGLPFGDEREACDYWKDCQDYEIRNDQTTEKAKQVLNS